MHDPFNVALPDYEGPLDLLWHLIRLNNVDIFDIPIAKITADFLRHIRSDPRISVLALVDFYYFASRLLAIKISMLFPDSDNDMHEDPRIEIVEELIEFQRIKKLSEQLQLTEYIDNIFTAHKNKEQVVSNYYTDTTKTLVHTNIIKERIAEPTLLADSLRRLLSISEQFNIKAFVPHFSLVSMQERLLKYLQNSSCYLKALMLGNNRHAEMLAAILVTLVFCIENKVQITQIAPFSPVIITLK